MSGNDPIGWEAKELIGQLLGSLWARLRIRPARASVCSPLSTATSPFTMTKGIPVGDWAGLAKVGGNIGMIFQDAMTALNPVFTVGSQLTETLKTHNPDLSNKAAAEKAIGLLSEVGIPSAERRFKQYPHEYSGGMRQRAMIAIAIANRPRLLIADEPTNSLDVTIQAQVLDVLAQAKEDVGASTILITHHLGVIAEMADRVVVMYASQFVETGTVEDVFFDPQHPYTIWLLSSLPRLDSQAEALIPIRGTPPNASNFPSGCRFHDRCDLRDGREICATDIPDLISIGPGRASRCHFTDEVPKFAERLEIQMQSQPGTKDNAR